MRTAVPSDYEAIAAVADEWWGRPVLAALPRLFLDHFHTTSLVAESPSGMVGFLVGFGSPSQPWRAYVHFVAVAPQARRTGLARRLYDTFIDRMRAEGRTTITAITSPGNSASIAFHQALGFTVSGPVTGYDGPGTQRILFERRLF
ncbi:MAG: GNAT family N-acetyltransferase [Actinomycetales bacterium]|nr:GNAT family N-acetyltransferase [Actinomycetales bacterium]